MAHKSYLFYTSDGFTYDSNHQEANNLQILGHGEGNTVLQAFECFKENQDYIKTQAYKNVMAVQTIGNTIFNLEL